MIIYLICKSTTFQTIRCVVVCAFYDASHRERQSFAMPLLESRKSLSTFVQQILSMKSMDLSHIGVVALNEMQQTMLQKAREHDNLILLSPTGSGKTLAYMLPLVSMLRTAQKGIQAVVLVPTRELAQQTEQVFRSLKTTYPVMSCYGGRPTMNEHRLLREVNPSVLIATPGRLKDHIEKGNVDLNAVQLRVIDEFDKCLELGFEEEMNFILSMTTSATHTYLLSATDSEEIPHYVDMDTAVRLNFLETSEQHLEQRLKCYKVISPEKDKLETLLRLLATFGTEQSIVFANHRESAERIYQYLKKQQVYCELFHGGMEQDRRERALYKFSGGSTTVLISTDLAARGLDLPDIRHIVHYHLPVAEDAYTHRNGRTARWENEGSAYVILSDDERRPTYLCEESLLPYPLDMHLKPRFSPPLWTSLYIGKGKKDKISKGDIAGFLIKKGDFSPEDIGRIDVRDRHAYVAVKRKGAEKRLALLKNEKLKSQKFLIEPAY